MACKLALFIAMVVLPAIVGATEFIVGDDEGWKVGVNYNTWAAGKEFKVGDKLVFNYNAGAHNVLRVTGPDFRACNTLANSIPLTSGHDEITLSTSGRKWYICGKSNHCASGMKLFINVVTEAVVSEADAPSPSPSTAWH